jgi:hypothetical protein
MLAWQTGTIEIMDNARCNIMISGGEPQVIHRMSSSSSTELLQSEK